MSNLNEVDNNTSVDNLSQEQVIALVKASVTTLHRRNSKLITLFDTKMKDGFLTETEQMEFLDGMYTAITDYSKTNRTLVNTIQKYGFEINEALKDYKNSNKSIVWKIGYATIQYEIANRSSRRLRLYMNLYMTSKSLRESDKHNWSLSDSEKKYMKILEKVVSRVTPYIRIEQETDVNMNDIMINFSRPVNSSEFYWPFNFDDNPANAKELQKIIMETGYQDDDLDMKTNAVFTTDHSYGLSLACKADDCYIFLIKKTGHYWEPVLVNKKTLIVKYNFTRSFNDNIQLLLRYYENIFPLRIKK